MCLPITRNILKNRIKLQKFSTLQGIEVHIFMMNKHSVSLDINI